MTQFDRAQTGADLLARCLQARNVPFVFGIPVMFLGLAACVRYLDDPTRRRGFYRDLLREGCGQGIGLTKSKDRQQHGANRNRWSWSNRRRHGCFTAGRRS